MSGFRSDGQHPSFLQRNDLVGARLQLQLSFGVAIVLTMATLLCLVALGPAFASPARHAGSLCEIASVGELSAAGPWQRAAPPVSE